MVWIGVEEFLYKGNVGFLVSHHDSRSDTNGESEPGSGHETINRDSLPVFFFSKLNLSLQVYKQFL